MEDLIKRFIQSKRVAPTHVNELLDFSQQLYIEGDISSFGYRTLIQKLEQCGASKPDYGLNHTAENEMEEKFSVLF